MQKSPTFISENIQLSVQPTQDLDPSGERIGLLRSDSFFPGLDSVSEVAVSSSRIDMFQEEGEFTRRDIVLRFENRAIVPLSLVVDNPWPVLGMVLVMGLTEQITRSALAEVSKITKSEQSLTIPQINLPVGQQAKLVLNAAVSSDKGFSGQIEMKLRFR